VPEIVKPREGFWSGEILTDVGTDYEHRMLIPKSAWGNYLGLVYSTMEHDNFKPVCHDKWEKHLGAHAADKRHAAMLGMWWTLYEGWPRDDENVISVMEM